MQRFDPLTASLCEQLKEDISAALEPIAAKYGICLGRTHGVLSNDAEKIGINLSFFLPERPDSVASRKEENDYRCYAEGFGMSADWLGKEFKRGHFNYKVAGLKLSAPEKCVILKRSDGVRWQENGKLVARYLG